ncbi:hypothetical protein Pla52o_55540 [Novipirellula galeiformis]|uniref:Uncharacterized protein n=1 Tax=Novipirellula galeiformis TaxID=2528004 RepID=A0A5C6BTM2_9BACT|nr:hypothetical protein Pla52o_55540 [Novipirellula galeiformis]
MWSGSPASRLCTSHDMVRSYLGTAAEVAKSLKAANRRRANPTALSLPDSKTENLACTRCSVYLLMYPIVRVGTVSVRNHWTLDGILSRLFLHCMTGKNMWGIKMLCLRWLSIFLPGVF